MDEHELFQKTFSHLHASEETRQEVIKMMNRKSTRKPMGKQLAAVAAAAALISALGIAASATGFLDTCIAKLIPSKAPSQGIVDTVGDGISTEKPDLGPLTPPDMERLDTNADAVLQLTGDYLCQIEAELTVHETRFTFHDFLIDENGSGILTYSVSDPNGVTFQKNGYGQVTLNSVHTPSLYNGEKQQGARHMDSYNYLVSGSSGDTTLEMAIYFSCFDTYVPGSPLELSISYAVQEDESQDPVEMYQVLSITPICQVPVKTFTDSEGNTVAVSPISILIDWHTEGELIDKELVIQYTDGTEYIVKSGSRSINNTQLGLIREAETPFGNIVLCFNRLVDADKIASITLQGSVPMQEETVSISRTYLP